MNNRTLVLSVLGLIIIAGAIYIFKPPTSVSTTQHNFNFVIHNKDKSGRPEKMNVTEGDQVQITVNADQDWPELHVHGYELQIPIKANTPTIASFTANKTGSFEVELHFSETNDSDSLSLGTLQVYPK